MGRKLLLGFGFRLGSGSTLYEKSDPDPVKNGRGQQHCMPLF